MVLINSSFIFFSFTSKNAKTFVTFVIVCFSATIHATLLC